MDSEYISQEELQDLLMDGMWRVREGEKSKTAVFDLSSSRNRVCIYCYNEYDGCRQSWGLWVGIRSPVWNIRSSSYLLGIQMEMAGI